MVEANSSVLYTKPWTRMNPFLSGAAIGWLLYKVNGKSISFSGLYVFAYWLVAAALFAFTIFMTYKRDILPVLCATMLSLGKYIFGLFIGSLIVMSHLGYGGNFVLPSHAIAANNFNLLSIFIGGFTRSMGHRMFVHLGKLTFTMYMVSPMVVTAFYGLKEVSTHFDEITTVRSVFLRKRL